MKNYDFQEKQIQISDLSAATYIVMIHGVQGRLVKQLIKK